MSVGLSEFEGWDYCLATGGDDQALHVFLFSVERSMTASTLYVSKVSDVSTNPLSHSAAIKGLHMEGKYILSTGPDQRLFELTPPTQNRVSVPELLLLLLTPLSL